MLELKHIVKDYYINKEPYRALHDINITFSNSGFVTILGPSGCGKTTLLNIIGGLDHYTEGDLIINGVSTKIYKDADWDDYRNKRIGFVFQHYNLIPHLSVLENVELALTLTGVAKEERKKRALEVLKIVGLEKEAKKKPNTLSGGQMQRVAIARSLVNNPDIILADEPTGALDSITSVQVMDILKNISKNKLVIMVTHNVEIANKYSTRTIRLKDGSVISDEVKNDESGEEETKDNNISQNNKKSSMSFFTASCISAKNIFTKKGRTILTAVAGSFGIIGVALVLALSSGFSAYVSNVETTTANSLPISIARATVSVDENADIYERFPSDDTIISYSSSSTTVYDYHYNTFTQEYIEYVEQLKEDGLAGSILFNQTGLSMNLLSKTPNGNIVKVDENGSTGSFSSEVVSSITALPTTVWHELYGDEEYTLSLYDVLAGEFPQTDDEVVLIVDSYNRVYRDALINLGLIDATDYREYISFDELVGHEFKVFPNSDIYTNKYIGQGTYTDLHGEVQTIEIDRYEAPNFEDDSNARNTYWNDSSKGRKLTLSGIIRVKENSYIDIMQPSIGYLSGLKEDIFNANRVSDISTSLYDKNWAVDSVLQSPSAQAELLKMITDPTYVPQDPSLEVFRDYTNIYDIINRAFYFFDPGDIKTPSTTPLTSVGVSEYLTLGRKYSSDLSNEYGTHADTYLSLLANYLAYSLVTSIVIFPNSLDDKEQILTYLDAWNEGKPEDEQILYTDTIGEITNALGIMINLISIVLIAFASSALLVSCVMTAIITYTSVLERTKEIGILRAIGARKKDVSRLFQSENFIIGAVSGVFGVVVAALLCFPINAIVNSLYTETYIGNIAFLPWQYGLILVAVSIILNIISGLIPSFIAAKKDPVEALRSD